MTHTRDGTCCAGHSHAFIQEKVSRAGGKAAAAAGGKGKQAVGGASTSAAAAAADGDDNQTAATAGGAGKGGKYRYTACPGGGTCDAPKNGLTKESRVDFHDKDGWRGTELGGCPARTLFLPSGDLVCPRWCITFKKGTSRGRAGCFGRLWYDRIPGTVVTRAEPHNMEIVHPAQDRVLTVRENARCQGFPDWWVFVGLGTAQNARRLGSISERYKQVGNAVAPPVASALGRCLLLAVGKSVDPKLHVVCTPDPAVLEAYAAAQAQGLVPYSVAHEVQEDDDGAPPALQGRVVGRHVQVGHVARAAGPGKRHSAARKAAAALAAEATSSARAAGCSRAVAGGSGVAKKRGGGGQGQQATTRPAGPVRTKAELKAMEAQLKQAMKRD